MDILWALLTLPYAPVRGLTAVVKVIAREAESQQYNPANIRRELEELDAAEAAGEISAEERDRGQQQVLDRLTGGAPRPPASPDRESGRGGAEARRRTPSPDRESGRGGADARRRKAGTRARASRPGPQGARRRSRDGGEGGESDGGSDPRRRRQGP
ncbi:gas vesicle protein GvpG [Micromonospora phytophila]|uniref:gas vesicle protein GvpG n=1 Tax=Micromonospora phytophila TaxID=709888 RepID=UPI002030B614|nr:gas vesicle protein GvpG [Micromonospora phytophila]MCM0676287.1 gas vesicle protein GvpG [Micromonospora phytophila]